MALLSPYTNESSLNQDNIVDLTVVDSNLSLIDKLSVQIDIENSAANASTFIDGVLASGTVTITDYTLAHLTAATGSLTVVDYTKLLDIAVPSGVLTFGTPNDGSTVIVTGPSGGPYTFTKVLALPGANEFTDITELEALIEAIPGLNSSEDGTDITLVVTIGGTGPNSWTVTGTDSYSGLSITFSGGFNYSVNVNGTVLTAVPSSPSATEFIAETSNDVTATNLEVAVEAVPGINSIVSTNVVSITATPAGAAGNSKTLDVSGSNTGVTRSGATLTGGIDAAVVTVAGHALTESTDWNSVTNNDTAADNLAAAIDALSEVQAANPAAAVVTVKAATIGTAGNSITTTKTGGGVTVQQATLSGGLNSKVDGTLWTISLTAHGYSTALKVNYDVLSGTTITNLVDNTDYWVIKIDANTIALATTENNANSGTRIHISDANDAVGGGSFSLTPAALDCDITLLASNDGENFGIIDGPDNVTTNSTLLYQLPTPTYKYLRVSIEPNDSEVDVIVTPFGKSLS